MVEEEEKRGGGFFSNPWSESSGKGGAHIECDVVLTQLEGDEKTRVCGNKKFPT